MNNYPFKNYEGFKELFVREDGRRKNKVLLDFMMSKAVKLYFKKRAMHFRNYQYNISDMSRLREITLALIRWSARNDDRLSGSIRLLDDDYAHPIYSSDEMSGICEDGDFMCYRYRNSERDNQVFKMRIGKFFRHIIEACEFGRTLPESVKIWLCEEISRDWQSATRAKLPEYELVVDDDFERIYNRGQYEGYADFHSCMTNACQHGFYEDAVKAKAASLRSISTGKILARCVIFSEVHDSAGNVLRLAERQYSMHCDDALKMILVYALINGGHIDGYKKVGANCQNTTAWLDTKHNKIEDTEFWISCDLDYDSTLSYQDSFKWYDMDERIAKNFPFSSYTHQLDTTDETLDGSNYDSWHDYCTSNDVVVVFSGGREYTCDEDDLSDFVWVENDGEYHHRDDVCYCHYCNEYYLSGVSYYSELTDESYCCEDCLIEAEREYKERHWTWSEKEDEYVDPDDVVTFYEWNSYCNQYDEYEVSEDYAVANGEEYNGDYYDTLEHIDEDE